MATETKKRKAGPACEHGYVRRGFCAECKKKGTSAAKADTTDKQAKACIRHSWRGQSRCQRCGAAKGLAAKRAQAEAAVASVIPPDAKLSAEIRAIFGGVADW